MKFLTIGELLDQSGHAPLIEGVLNKDTFAVLFAKYGKGKTFLALDMAVAVLSGSQWFGRNVSEGVVAYVAAEGIRGFRQRLRARLGARLRDPTDPVFKRLLVLPHAVNFLDPKGIADLIDTVKAMPIKPAFIEIDTLARCMVGGEENSAQHMGVFVEGCDRLRAETGATILGDGDRTRDIQLGKLAPG